MRKCYPAQFYRTILFLTIAVLTTGIAFPQTTVQIGTGTDVPTSTLYSPVYRFSATSATSGSRSNILFTQDELAAVGIVAGSTITAVQFNKTNAANFVTPATHTMYVANTTNTSLPTTTTWASILASHTQVLTSNAFNIPLAAGWVTWNITPFVYTGGSLEIATETAMVGNGGATDAFQWEYTSSVPTDRIVGVSNPTGATLNGTVAAYKHRPNIRITFAASGPCTNPPVPGDLVPSSNPLCLGSILTISLTNGTFGSGQTYQWQSSTDDINWTDISGATEPMLQVTPTADAYYRVIVTCGVSVTSASLLVPVTPCYCASVPSNVLDTEIFDVTVNGVSNSSNCTVAATGPGSILNRYSNFYPLGSLTTLPPGASVPFSIQVDDCSGTTFFNAGAAVWIDFNRDGDFLDAGEQVYVEATQSLAPRTITGTFIVPPTAVAGVTGMRVIVAETNSGPDLQPCMSYSYGETEDYLVTIGTLSPCAGTVSAGTISTSNPIVCANEDYTLTSSGYSYGLGIIYQWQSSPDNVNWTDIVGANSPTYATTQTATTYYRFIVNCTNSGSIDTSGAVIVTTPLNVTGTFTINSNLPTAGTNFNSFADAYALIKCGITGPVVFNVDGASGPYNEQLIISPVPGASAVNTITFNGNGATIAYASGNTDERAVIKLNGADHITFDSLTIDATGGTYGFGVHLTADADSNTIRNCTVNTDLTSTSTNFAGIVISGSNTSAITTGSLSDGNTIESNNVNGGYYGITLLGTTTAGNQVTGNSIINNVVSDPYLYGIYVTGTSGALVESNDISRPTRTAAGTIVYGIYFTGLSTSANISKNRIHNPFGGMTSAVSDFYGIYLTGVDATAGAENIISNNAIYDLNGEGIIYGMYNNSSNYASYYHNTISIDNAASNSTDVARGFYQLTTANNIVLINNLITISRGGTGANYALYFGTAATTFTSDYNDLFVVPGASTYVGYNGASQATLTDWQTATSQDANSVSINPAYLNYASGDLRPTEATLDNLGTPVGIGTDILGVARSATTPDIGAFEFHIDVCVVPPVPGTISSNYTGAVCPNTLINFNLIGYTFGVGQTYTWEAATSVAGPWTPISGALDGPAFDYSVTATQYYRAAVTCNGNTAYSDTLQIIVNPLFPGGTYTINSTIATGGTNFQTFNDAYLAMKCGIAGPVVMNVVAGTGPYNEQLIMDTIQGTSGVNTITFNGNGESISFTSTDGSERAVIKLNGTDHVIFDGLVVNATGTTTSEYGFGIQLMNNADSNRIVNCIINSDTTLSSTNYAGIVINSSATSATATGTAECDGNIINNNIVNGGNYSMTLVSSSTVSNANNQITNNSFRNFYTYGLYVNGSFNTLIDSNHFSRPDRSDVGVFYGIYFTGLSTSANITRNTLTNPFGGEPASTSTFYGIYHSSVDAIATLENKVTNNLIYNITGNGDVYGIYNSGSDNVLYYHNTINIDGAGTGTTDIVRGFHQVTTAAGVVFRNNIVNISRGGGSPKYALYWATATSSITSDNNDLFISSTEGVNNIGYNGDDQPLLINWQNVTGQDQNSVSNNPLYVDPITGNYAPTNSAINDLGAPLGIAIDILGAARDASTPDIGAYEFTPPGCAAPPLPGEALVSSTPVCENTLVSLSVTGNSTGSGQTYVWQAASDSVGPYADISGALTNPTFTITATETQWYRIAVTCSTSTEYSVPVLLQVTPALPGGVYTIDATQPASPTNFISFNEAKNAMACGIAGPVIFNVEPNSGPYLEQLILDSIPGTSATNTVTFNGFGNTIQFGSSTTTERAVIKLNSSDYVTFDSLTIDATGGTYGWGVQIMNNADSNTIRNSTIITSTTSTLSNFAGIVISNSATAATSTTVNQSDGNLVENNSITGGYYGFTSVSGSAGINNNNKFINNDVKDFYFYGTYINYSDGTIIEGNSYSRPTRTTVSTFQGIYFTSFNSNARVSKNRLFNPFAGNTASTSAAYVIEFSSVDAPSGQENRVTNNLIHDIDGSGSIYGFYNSSSDNVHYYHNTLSLDNTANSSTGLTRAFYQTGAADGIVFRNNIISITRGGTGDKHGIYRVTATSTITSDRNDVYVNGAAGDNSFGYAAGDQLTLAAWQTATTQDANSRDVDPLFTSLATADLVPMQALIDNIGTPVGVTTDILGNPRSGTTPDPGAHEFAITPCVSPPTAGASVATPSSGICLGTTILLDLSGNSIGGFQQYVWQIGPSATGPWTDISDTLYSPELSHELTSYTNVWFQAAVTCSGNTVYSTPVQVTLNPALIAGDYTIDSSQVTGGSNFQSFTDAVAALQCGISGSVRFHAVPGTYDQQFRISKIPGASASATVTFMSQNGDPASVILTHNSTTSDSNYILKLDSASYVTFKNITFLATNNTFGRAIELAGTASADSILNSVITVPVASSTSTNLAAIFGTALRGSDNVIKGNTITNGSSNIYLSGTTTVSNRYLIDSNTVSGAYYYGIYTGNINRLMVNNNTVTRSGLLNTSAYGIYATNCDSAYQFTNNRVTITNAGTTVYGIYLTGCQSNLNERGRVANNKVTGTTGNSGNQYGLYVTTSTNNNSVNNVIVVNTSGSTSYGIYSTGTGGIHYLNNSVQSSATSATANVAAYFSQSSGSNGAVNIRNNIFSHTGGGRAMYIVNPRFIYSDYNMFFTTGATLIQWGTANIYATLQQWRDTSYWDFNSIVYQPAFTSATDLMPDVASADVWAIHGRGEQIAGNDVDFNNNSRPTTLTVGVPDLGAYEFVPTSTPVLLSAFPAAPAPNTTQVFMLGTDTVTKISWGANVPSTIEGRRYSGVVPPGLAAGQDYMYFYTDFDITGTMPTGHAVQQFYIDPWLGFIGSEPVIKLGRTDASNAWVIGLNSVVEIYNNTIDESNLDFIDKYTGLTDGAAVPPPPIVINPSDSSNRGTKFWVGYGHHQDFGSGNNQEMVLYLGAAQTPANVTVRINGTSWVKNYFVPANSVISSDFMPKYGFFDARLLVEGLSQRGISIESDVPITAYAHIYGNTNSGATMLLPVGTYGFEYYAITSKQNYAANTYSWVNVVAAYDSTVVEITPSKPTLNGRPAGVPFTVELKKGEVYQVLGAIISGSDGYDLTGTKVKSIANANNKCYPIAVFSGSSRTNLGCGTSNPTSSGDNIIQQNFPFSAWGRRYLTAPTSASTAASTLHNNIFKVAVKDPTTVVLRNGTPLTNLVDNLYYQFESNTADFIEADKPVMVAQFIPSQGGNAACGNTGVLDPEMIYLSPIEQGIKSVALYRNTEYNIVTQYLTLIIPTGGLTSLLIDGSNVFDYIYPHSQPGYTVVVKGWAASIGQTFVTSDSSFTAITYGLGSAESYGYNAGTLVKNLNVFPAITNVFATTGTTSDYTCAETPFTVSFLSTVQPQIIEWLFSQANGLSPNADVVQNSPTASDTTVINGVTYYTYSLTQQYTIANTGTYYLPIFITHPDVEGCNNRMEMTLQIEVLPAPVADFDNTQTICINNSLQFNGTGSTSNATPISSWHWDFDDNGATADVQNTTHIFTTPGTYDVELSLIAADGCIADTTKPVEVTAGPAATFVPDSVSACIGDDITFTVENPVTGAVYTWYDAATGGNLVATGTSHTITNLSGQISLYVETDLNGCLSFGRTEVEVTVLPALLAPVVTLDSAGTNLLRFTWTAVTGATGYEVSTDNGLNWQTPSSGTTGLSHTVTGLQIGQSVTLLVRVLGGCEAVVSAPVSGTTVTDQVFIPNSFTPNGDGRNDVLLVYSNVIRELRFVVFNQWGEKIFESRTQSSGWNGIYKGKMQPSGVYMYVCDVTLNDGTRIQKKGSINLIR